MKNKRLFLAVSSLAVVLAGVVTVAITTHSSRHEQARVSPDGTVIVEDHGSGNVEIRDLEPQASEASPQDGSSSVDGTTADDSGHDGTGTHEESHDGPHDEYDFVSTDADKPDVTGAESTQTGTLRLVHVDADSGDTWSWSLETPQGNTTLYVTDPKPDLVNTQVTVDGTIGSRAGSPVLNVSSLVSAESSVSTSSVSTQAVTGERKALVIMVNFADARTEPFTSSQVSSAYFGAGGSSVASYMTESSDSQASLTGDVTGWLQVASYFPANCDSNAIQTAARAAAVGAGYNLSSYNHPVYLFPYNSTCAWSGRGYVGIGGAWINGTLSVFVGAHELGHNFGAWHSATSKCTSGSGTTASLASSCTQLAEYGDPFAVMGGGMRTYHATDAGIFGWLSSKTATVSESGTYTLTRRHSGSGTELLRLQRNATQYLDLEIRRTSSGFDSFSATDPAVTGVSVRLFTSGRNTYLIDSTPGTTTFSDAPFKAGTTLSDTANKITIKVLTVDTDTASVQITVPDRTAPTTPGSLSATPSLTSAALSWTASSDNVAVTGYTVWRDSTKVATLAATARSYTATRLVPNGSYLFSVRAIDAAANASAAASVTVTTPADTAAPAKPVPVVSSLTATGYRVSWPVPVDNVGTASYRVNHSSWAASKTQTTSYVILTGLAPQTAYTFEVCASDGAGNLSECATVSTTTPSDTTAPSAPRTASGGVVISGRNITLKWTSATDNVGVSGYQITRTATGQATVTYTTPSLTYSDVAPAAGTWSYSIKALDVAGNIGTALVLRATVS